jgi:hypothetical protein
VRAACGDDGTSRVPHSVVRIETSLHKFAVDALLQAVERLAATQDQMKREMTRLQAADLEILAKIPAPPPQSPASPKRKPPAVPPQRAPTTALAPHP